MSTSFFIRQEVSFDEIKPYGFDYVYNEKTDEHLIVSEKQLDSLTVYHTQDDDGLNYIYPRIGSNGGFTGFTISCGNDGEFLFDCLVEELGYQVISEFDYDFSYFIDVTSEFFGINQETDEELYDKLFDIIDPLISFNDLIDAAYIEEEKLAEWLPRNLKTIKKLLKRNKIWIKPKSKNRN